MAGIDVVGIRPTSAGRGPKSSFGAHGIVYFDPFHYKVSVYARVAAGITIDTWFGDITFSVSLGARIEVEGPDFHGTVTVEVGPCDVTLEFGSQKNNTTQEAHRRRVRAEVSRRGLGGSCATQSRRS